MAFRWLLIVRARKTRNERLAVYYVVWATLAGKELRALGVAITGVISPSPSGVARHYAEFYSNDWLRKSRENEGGGMRPSCMPATTLHYTTLYATQP